MTWMRLDATVRDHRKIGRLARALGVPVPHALGHLVCLWTWTLTQAPDGDLDDLRAEELAEAARWEGDPDTLRAALVSARLLDETEHGLRVHGWREHAEGLKSAERTARWREKKRSGDVTVTSPYRTVTSDETRRDETRRDETIVAQCRDAAASSERPSAPVATFAPGSAHADPTPTTRETHEDAPRAREEATPPPEGRVEAESPPDAKPGPAASVRPAEVLRLIPDEPDEPPVAVLPLRGTRAHRVTRAEVERWREAYPAVDVRAELARMVAWLDANPERRPASKAPAFVVRWLSRAQDDAAQRGSRGAQRGGPGRALTAVERVAERAREALEAEARAGPARGELRYAHPVEGYRRGGESWS